MQLKEVIESPCGLRYVFDHLDIQSSYGRRCLLDMPMMQSTDEITQCYERLRAFFDFVDAEDNTPYINTFRSKLQSLKDIRTTIKHLSDGAVLDDIELFEVKHLAMLAADMKDRLLHCGLDKVVSIPDTGAVVGILDPDGLKLATFYIYDSYSESLKAIRALIRKSPQEQEHLLLEANAIEEQVRQELSHQLRRYAVQIETAQTAMAMVDINLAKALQMKQMGLCFPDLAKQTTTYEGLFHPQVKEALAAKGKAFQAIDIRFGQQATLITGANMGGKTVVLKSLALCQYLFQYGLGIPAKKASIAVKEEIHFCIGDEQSIEKGLSSFAAEMKNIDIVIKASRKGHDLLALIDEPARTTNPTEGVALAAALISILSQRHVSVVMTTHYDIEPANSRRLRVRGFENGSMNYELVEVKDGEVPHEALNIAESLGIDNEWIQTARTVLKDRENLSNN